MRCMLKQIRPVGCAQEPCKQGAHKVAACSCDKGQSPHVTPQPHGTYEQGSLSEQDLFDQQ